MTGNNKGLVVAVFYRAEQAEQALRELWRSGFAEDRVDMVSRSQGETLAAPDIPRQADLAEGARTGAVAGGIVGGVAGGVATVLIPGLGMVLGGGLLFGILGGAALGAAGGTFLGPFIAMEIPENAAHHYTREVEEGRIVLLVQAFDRAEEARAILARHGGVEFTGQ
jgi:hypothetical protein